MVNNKQIERRYKMSEENKKTKENEEVEKVKKTTKKVVKGNENK